MIKIGVNDDQLINTKYKIQNTKYKIQGIIRSHKGNEHILVKKLLLIKPQVQKAIKMCYRYDDSTVTPKKKIFPTFVFFISRLS